MAHSFYIDVAQQTRDNEEFNEGIVNLWYLGMEVHDEYGNCYAPETPTVFDLTLQDHVDMNADWEYSELCKVMLEIVMYDYTDD
mmetsp:Transcript_15570/g.11341  ORF Transcript_15570/g.11341 Transcript_15570/m.11341 type:complete len:84 (-) Transcript_15570:130-381(-)